MIKSQVVNESREDLLQAEAYKKASYDGVASTLTIEKAVCGLKKGSFNVKNACKGIVLGLLVLVLAACGNAEAQGELTAQKVFEQAKEASNKLEKVRANIVFEDYWKTTAPEKRMNWKVELNSDASLHPLTIQQRMIVQPLNEEPWDRESYTVKDRAYVKDGQKLAWEYRPYDAVSELFDAMERHVNPSLDLTLFDTFKDDFTLEPIDYGYNLKLSLTRDRYQEFRKIMFGLEEDLDSASRTYPMINKFDVTIGIDSKTFYVTDFKMALDTTTYSTTQVDGNSHRMKKSITAVYSRFDNKDNLTIPTEILEAAAQ